MILLVSLVKDSFASSVAMLTVFFIGLFSIYLFFYALVLFPQLTPIFGGIKIKKIVLHENNKSSSLYECYIITLKMFISFQKRASL